MAKRKGKISIATLLGLGFTLKQIMDAWKASDGNAAAMTAVLTGWRGPTLSERPNTFDAKQLITTWSPLVGGAMISKYVGGPKGLNVNAQLKGIPIFKL